MLRSVNTLKVPRLVFVSGPRTGEVLDVVVPTVAIGRSVANDVVVDDPLVSRSHAQLKIAQDGLVVEDLGSTSGTRVNGRRCTAATLLHNGDIIGFGHAHARVELPEAQSAHSEFSTASPGPSGQSANRFDIGQQFGESISNVGRDQYVQHVIASRESFARDIAATKTKARYLVWIGLALIIAAAAVELFGWHEYANSFTGINANTTSTTMDGSFRSYSSFVEFAAVLGIFGATFLIVGIVLHVVAASRRKQLLNSNSSPIGV